MEKRSSITRNTVNRRKHKTFATIGLIVFALAVVGLVTVAAGSIGLTSRIMDNTKEKQRLERFLLPVIMFDPGTFDSPQEADPMMILQSSIWSTLLSKDRDKMARDDAGYILPASDVDVQAAKLFGSEIKLQHQTVQDYENTFIYNEEKQIYSVPVIPQMAVYTPKILDPITHKGDLYTLQVGYIPPGNLWTTDADGNVYEPEPDKIMIVELKKVKDGYNIVALKDGPDTLGATSVPGQASQVTPSVSSLPDDEELPPEAAPGTTTPDTTSSVDEAASGAGDETAPVFTKVSASSTSEPGAGRTYEPEHVLDGDWDTAWVDGADGDGTGEWLLFEADAPQTVSGIRMTNGYTEKEILYQRNNRITKIQIEFSDGSTIEENLLNYDNLFANHELGVITFAQPVETTSIKITVLEVDRGDVYDDTCVSVIEFF